MAIEKVEEYVRLNGWLNVKLNPEEDQHIFEYSHCDDGVYHSISESYELFKEWKKFNGIK